MTHPTRTAAVALVPFLLAVGYGCDSSSPKSNLPTVEMKVGQRTYTLEVADTDKVRRFGLKRRDSLPADRGMLFVFAEEAPLGFYMEDCRIPLDIIFLDKDARVVSVKQLKPFDRTTVPSDAPAQYAIELNKGQAAAAGVKPGMRLALPPGLKARDP